MINKDEENQTKKLLSMDGVEAENQKIQEHEEVNKQMELNYFERIPFF